MDDPVLAEAEAILGHTFRDRELLRQALTHASIAGTRFDSNERLEFLGDAVLGFVVCEFLHARFEDLLEGDLTKIKSAVVSRETCARVACDLGLHEMLAIGKGMQGRTELPLSLAAAAYEAVIAAMYLDEGLDAARAFVVRTLEDTIVAAAESGHQENFKSVLQQHAQDHTLDPPNYILVEERGPDHAKEFLVAVELGEERFGPCWAESKKRAEQLAALTALELLGLIVHDDEGRVLYVPAKRSPA